MGKVHLCLQIPLKYTIVFADDLVNLSYVKGRATRKVKFARKVLSWLGFWNQHQEDWSNHFIKKEF